MRKKQIERKEKRERRTKKKREEKKRSKLPLLRPPFPFRAHPALALSACPRPPAPACPFVFSRSADPVRFARFFIHKIERTLFNLHFRPVLLSSSSSLAHRALLSHPPSACARCQLAVRVPCAARGRQGSRRHHQEARVPAHLKHSLSTATQAEGVSLSPSLTNRRMFSSPRGDRPSSLPYDASLAFLFLSSFLLSALLQSEFVHSCSLFLFLMLIQYKRRSSSDFSDCTPLLPHAHAARESRIEDRKREGRK